MCTTKQIQTNTNLSKTGSHLHFTNIILLLKTLKRHKMMNNFVQNMSQRPKSFPRWDFPLTTHVIFEPDDLIPNLITWWYFLDSKTGKLTNSGGFISAGM